MQFVTQYLCGERLHALSKPAAHTCSLHQAKDVLHSESLVTGLLHKTKQSLSLSPAHFFRKIKTRFPESTTISIVFLLREGKKRFKSNTTDSLRGTARREGCVYMLCHGPGRFYPLDQQNPASPSDSSLQALLNSCKQRHFCNGFSQKEIVKFFTILSSHIRLSLPDNKTFSL